MITRPSLFTGLSAFPLTPVTDDGIDANAFTGLVQRLAEARVDSITALGSTGSYAYLNRSERQETIELAVAAAGDIPVYAGIGAVRTRDVLAHAQDAQKQVPPRSCSPRSPTNGSPTRRSTPCSPRSLPPQPSR